jgi:enoyl-CoA hydratase/carnithine racemase
MLGHGWTLKAKFSELSFERTKGNNADHTIDKTFIAGINGSTLGMGMSKNLTFKKHG